MQVSRCHLGLLIVAGGSLLLVGCSAEDRAADMVHRPEKGSPETRKVPPAFADEVGSPAQQAPPAPIDVRPLPQVQFFEPDRVDSVAQAAPLEPAPMHIAKGEPPELAPPTSIAKGGPPEPEDAGSVPSERLPAETAAVAAADRDPDDLSQPDPAPAARRGEPPAEQSSGADQAAAENENYTVMKVYYGTDRGAISVTRSDRPVYLQWLVFTLLSAGITLILMAVACRYFRGRLMRVLAGLGLLATVGLGLLTAYAAVQGALAERAKPLKVVYGHHRGTLDYGTCEVSIPKHHTVGKLESPSILRLEFRQTPERHVVLLKVEPTPADEFFAACRACVEKSQQKGAFVFVHGFNVTFEDAARRTAQIAYDLKFDGAPIFFSWPSRGGLLQYAVDETNVVWTVPHLKEFLTEIARRSGARQVHLIAHSMGNRALTSALRELALESGQDRSLFREVVLTAPDIDAEVFRRDIAPAIVKTASRVTLYASSNDEALALSKQVHGYPRAGDTGHNLVIVPGVDTIDVSEVDTSLFGLGHSYYGSNDTVLADLFDLLHEANPPDKRKWLHSQRLGALKYWIFRR